MSESPKVADRPGIVIDADEGNVNGYAYPLTCAECGTTAGRPA